MSRSFTIVSSVLLLWIAPQTFAQWTCDTQGCANPAIVSTTAKTVAVGLDASVPPAPGPSAPSQIRTGVDANFQLWSGAGLGVPGVMINSVHDGGGGGILTNLMYNAASHIFWTGKVGVNTTSPSARLHISDGNATGNGNLFVQSTGGDGVIRLQGGGTNQGFIRYNDAGQYLSFSNSAYSNDQLVIKSTGNVGIGQPAPNARLDVAGAIHATGAITSDSNITAVFQDLAEWVPAGESLVPGTVVVLNRGARNEVVASSVAYDTSVAGVVSEQPGIILGKAAANKAQVATTGRVKVKVDASRASVNVGDLLVTSDVPGTAMKSEPVEISGRRLHQPGTILGKALEPLASGSGEILVLLSLQ